LDWIDGLDTAGLGTDVVAEEMVVVKVVGVVALDTDFVVLGTAAVDIAVDENWVENFHLD
jgi:hypothetical protein